MKNLNLYNIPEISEMLGYDEKETEDAIFRCEMIDIEEYYNGEYDEMYSNDQGYIKSTLKMPDYAKLNIE